MDTTGTFEMALVLASKRCFTTVHKYYTLEDWKNFSSTNKWAMPYVAISAGTSNREFDLVKSAISEISDI